jgi:hypothetical protein
MRELKFLEQMDRRVVEDDFSFSHRPPPLGNAPKASDGQREHRTWLTLSSRSDALPCSDSRINRSAKPA